MKALLSLFGVGFVFALGLGVSGMTDANKVIGFLNLHGAWDPSLGFVMVGAIGVHVGLYRFILHRPIPMFAEQFRVPTRSDIDLPLVGGSVVFGVGWGLGGYCPGPGLVSAVGMATEAVTFTGAMVVGMLLFEFVGRPVVTRAPQPTP